nr:DNA invertase [Escherichia coli]
MLRRYISATLLAVWLRATEQAHQRAAPSLLLNQRFSLNPYLYQRCIFN